MVYNPVDMEFPLRVIADVNHQGGKYLKALDRNGKPSTLGADDGIGVATALALLGDAALREYPLECLFTVQEETDMGGARECALENLTGTTLLNLDAEDLTRIIFGSAGGAETKFSRVISRVALSFEQASFRLSLSGLRGGHSGIDINKGRVNAIKALCRILADLDCRLSRRDDSGDCAGYDLYLCDFRRADVHKANAIPAAAEALITLPAARTEAFKKDFASACESLKVRHGVVESGLSWSIDAAPCLQNPLDASSTDALLCMISHIPSGVIAMIPGVPDVVETSSNLFNVGVDAHGLVLESSNRSSNEKALKALGQLQIEMGKIFNCTVETGMNGYPSWQPDVHSRVLKTATDVYRAKYGASAAATVIHAGLECGTLAARFMSEKKNALDCISIGPDVRSPHTSGETLEIESKDGAQTVREFFECVQGIVHALFGSHPR
jgi:dipeptidase D